MRLNFFDLKGQLINEIKIFKPILSLALSRKGMIAYAPLRTKPYAPLIDILNPKGKLVRSFGQAKFGSQKKNWQIPNFIKIALNPQEELLIDYEHFPLVARYSLTGELMAEYPIETPVMKAKEKINLKRVSGKDKGGLLPVLFSLYCGRNSFYLLNSFPRLEILEFDYHGNLLHFFFYEYNYELPDVYYADLVVKEEGEKLAQKTFYTLKTNPTTEITILKINHEGVY